MAVVSMIFDRAQLKIQRVRNQKVILDDDLARIYGVPTKALNQAVKRNRKKFPVDFIFQLTAEEVAHLRLQNVTSSTGGIRSQFVTAYKKRNIRFHPYAFTEHGAIMAATVLNSPRAIQMSVFVVRAFVKMREELTGNQVLEKRLTEIEKTLLHHHGVLNNLFQKIRPLLLSPPEPPKRKIGFHVEESRAVYGRSKGIRTERKNKR